jgi:uncharacterized membrane protein YfcA
MLSAVLTPLLRSLCVVLAGIGAGVANGIAGGGTFISFPTLLALGVPALAANVTTSVGVVPSYVGGIRGYRAELRGQFRLLRTVFPACLLGAITGCTLLLAFPSSAFRAVIPWLIGAGTVLFAISPLVTKRLAHIDHDHPARKVSLVVGVFVVAIYGGYFGAGLGILLLAVMAISLPFDMPTLQGLRNALSTIINLCAAVVFILRGHLVWSDVACLLVGTLLGGLLGTSLLRKLTPQTVRMLIVLLGAGTTIRLLW